MVNKYLVTIRANNGLILLTSTDCRKKREAPLLCNINEPHTCTGWHVITINMHNVKDDIH